MVEVADDLLRRTTRVARLLDPATRAALTAPRPLYDAVLVCVRSDYLTLTGIERVPDALGERVFEYAQSWLITPV